jgi:hypothetical protein
MAILKLQNVNDSATFRVKQAEVVAGKFGPQVKFEAENGDLLFISQDTAMRQLSRIPLEVIDCAGETLTFYRSENKSGGAPYWNISVADAVDRSKPAEPKRLGSPYVPGLDGPEAPIEEDDGFGAFSAEIDSVLAVPTGKRLTIVQDYVHLLKHLKANSGLTDEQAIQSAAATIFIAWDKAGVR